jgi:hypothetical protein
MLEIIQQMHTDGEITPQQKHGILVCLPKTTMPTRPDEYRALTLLNADLKILARITVQRLRPGLPDILHPSQQCGTNGKSMLDAVSTIRDAIACEETTNKELCILSLDFQAAFDNISHTYLYKILKAHGFDENFQRQIKSMYEGETAPVQINGHISSPIPILCSIRKGRPLIMHLYALCLNPLLHMIDKKLRGIRIDPRKPKTAIIAYADDVTIMLTSKDEIKVVQYKVLPKCLRCKINLDKSKAMAIGRWDTTNDSMGIKYQNNIKIRGINFHPKTGQTTDRNWAQVTRKIRAQARETYNRELGIEQRIQYIHKYLMAKAWYVAQLLPLPTSYERQLNTTINWYVWNGAIFKVPLSTLQRPKEEGGLDLINIGAKSRALYYYRMEKQKKMIVQ